MNTKQLLICSFLLVGSSANAAVDMKLRETASKFVPNSTLVRADGDEFRFQTAKGSIVEVELNRDGTIDEVEGDQVLSGDEFVPGGGLMNLADATKALWKAGITPAGDWSFEKSSVLGWVYEFEGIRGKERMEYTINAKNGKLELNRSEPLPVP